MEVHESVEISVEAEQFYNEIRGLVVVFLFFALLFTLAHFLMHYFLKQENISFLDRDDRLVSQILQGIGTFTLTLCLASYVLLPFSIAANEVLVLFPDSYYVQWLNSALVHSLFLVVSLGTKLSCVLLPFSYFLLEAQGFYRLRRTVWSKLLEAASMVILSYVLVFGTLWSFFSLLNALEFTSLDNLFGAYIASSDLPALLDCLGTFSWSAFVTSVLPAYITLLVDYVHTTASMFGLILLVVCSPIGLLSICMRLIAASICSLPDLTSQNVLQSKLCRLHYETSVMRQQLELESFFRFESNVLPLHPRHLATLSQRSSIDTQYIVSQLAEFHQHIADLDKRIFRSRPHLLADWLRPLPYCALFTLVLFLLLLSLTYVSFNIIDLSLGLVFNHDYHTPQESAINVPSWTKRQATVSSLGRQPLSVFGHFGAFVQICLIHFVLLTSLWGFYTTPPGAYFRPKPHATSFHVMLANTVCVLLFTSALPLQVNLLGFTSLVVPQPPAIFRPTVNPSRGSLLVPIQQSYHSQPTALGQKAPYSDSSSATMLANQADDLHTSVGIQQSFTKLSSYFLPFNLAKNFIYLFTSPKDVEAVSFTVKRVPQCTVPSTSACRDCVSQSSSTDRMELLQQTSNHSTGVSVLFIILLYNLGFLATSVWIAGRRLRRVTYSFSLEMLIWWQHVQETRASNRILRLPEANEPPLIEPS